jgi:hypothetical protein
LDLRQKILSLAVRKEIQTLEMVKIAVQLIVRIAIVKIEKILLRALKTLPKFLDQKMDA